MLIIWGHVLDSLQVLPSPDMYEDSRPKLTSYSQGFVFSGVKVKAKRLRSQIDLLKITPASNKKGSPFGEPFLFLKSMFTLNSRISRTRKYQ